MIIKSLVVAVFIVIIISLASALYHLIKGGGQAQSEKIVKALTFRIGLSVALFVLVFIAYATGLIKPEGIGARMQYLKTHPAQVKHYP